MLLAQFLLTSLLIELTPGPNMGWLALLSLRRGRLAGFAAVSGIALGLATAGLAAVFGLSLLIATTPWLFLALRFAGAAYLAYLVYAAVLPQFLGNSGSWRDIAKLTAGYVIVATLAHAGLVLLAGSASRLLGDDTRRKSLSRVSAVLLLLIAVWFFWAAEAPR